MAIIKWDPLNNGRTSQDRIDKLFDDSFPQRPHCASNAPRHAWVPAVDVYQTAQGVMIAIDLPGVNKEDVVLEIKDDELTIRGERYADPYCQATRYYRRERTCGTFHRVFRLHAVIPPEQIKARFNKGVLMVEIPEPEADHPRQIQVTGK